MIMTMLMADVSWPGEAFDGLRLVRVRVHSEKGPTARRERRWPTSTPTRRSLVQARRRYHVSCDGVSCWRVLNSVPSNVLPLSDSLQRAFYLGHVKPTCSSVVVCTDRAPKA